VAFDFCSLDFFVLLVLLLLKDCLNIFVAGGGAGVLDWLARSYFDSATPHHEVFHHVSDLLHQEGDGPFEKVHALGQVEGMNNIFVLFNVHFVVLDEDNGALVVVLAAVVWRAKNCDNRRECLVTSPSVHLVAVYLDLMGADN